MKNAKFSQLYADFGWRVLDSVIAGIDVGAVVCDSAGRVILSNPAAESILNAQPATLADAFIYDICPAPQSSELKAAFRHLSRAQASEQAFHEVTADFHGRTIECSTYPIHSADRMMIGAVILLRDVSREVDLARDMTEFAATVAHELRTPLTSLKGSIGLILGGAAGDVSDNDRLRTLLGIAARNSDRLIRLVDDMLEMAQVETGAMCLRLRVVTIDACVLRAVEETKALAEERQVKLITKVNGNIPPVVADQDRIEQVVVNLLSNAIKFSPTGGTVRTRVKAIRSHVEVEVIDQGPGVPDEDREHIFDKFYRGAAGATEPGTGLGLAISKAIIDQHGGRIYLRGSKKPGSVFVFTLPVPGEDELLRSSTQ